MSRKTILILVSIVIIGALGLWVYSLVNKTAQQGRPGASNNGGLSSLFPFFGGSNSGTQTPGGNTGTPETTGGGTTEGNTATNPLIQISTRLVAGFTTLTPNIMDTTTASQTSPVLPLIRFIEKGTGYMYEIDASGQNEKKVSGTSIIRSAEAYFLGADSVAIRYVKTDNQTVATFLGRLVSSGGGISGEVKGDFLADNTQDVLAGLDGKTLLYLLRTNTGSALYSVKPDGTGKKIIFSSSFSEWLISAGQSSMLATTRPSAGVSGYSYSVSKTGTFQKVLGPIPGLTSKISPDGQTILYTTSDGGTMALYAHHIKDGSETNLGLTTLSDKCVWSTDSVHVYCGAPEGPARAGYPDAWYQGVVHFSDKLWKIDTKTGVTTVISDADGNSLDAILLSLDQKESYLFFVNKNDGSLWALDLTKKSS